MTSYNWESTIVDPFLSLDDSALIPMLQDSYVPQSNTKSNNAKDPTNSNQASNSVSPPYSDSSPSPSSANDDAASIHNDSRPNGDTGHRRQASADDIDVDEQRPSKSPTTTENRLKRSIAPSRRKSGGERIHDESKLLKRKEQNRAAQRAFRERKEKHVKDLEDKVAQLEAKFEAQATENENLRDMLNRIQGENALLRQATFSSFSLPNNSAVSNNASSSNSFPAPEPGPSRTRTNSISTMATQLRDSQSNFDSQYPTFESPSASASLSALPDNTLTDVDLDSMSLFGGPFTTVASNPMFMSYRDPTESMNAFASFGGWDDMTLANTYDQFTGLSNLNTGDITGTHKANNNTISPYDVQFQAALAKKAMTQDLEPCVIDQLCTEMQRKATCSALH